MGTGGRFVWLADAASDTSVMMVRGAFRGPVGLGCAEARAGREVVSSSAPVGKGAVTGKERT